VLQLVKGTYYCELIEKFDNFIEAPLRAKDHLLQLFQLLGVVCVSEDQLQEEREQFLGVACHLSLLQGMAEKRPEGHPDLVELLILYLHFYSRKF
jgi:hypothetical protein